MRNSFDFFIIISISFVLVAEISRVFVGISKHGKQAMTIVNDKIKTHKIENIEEQKSIASYKLHQMKVC